MPESVHSNYNPPMKRTRLDLLLVERGLAISRAKAQAMIMAGQVRVDGQIALKPSGVVDSLVQLEIETGPRFASRGGDKLDAALTHFAIDVDGRICADVGASTGGFTDCLLQHGAAKVYAIDVGKGGLHWKLRNDPRVVVMEGVNARYVEGLPEKISFGAVDASFISLRLLLPVIKEWMTDKGMIVCLVKPQFEAGRQEAARGGGVIRDPTIHRRVLTELMDFTAQKGFGIKGLMRSPILGPKGNVEFLLWLGKKNGAVDLQDLIKSAGL